MTFAMSFPLGKPILVLITASIISGGFLAFHPEPAKKDLVLWTFVQSHADTYRSIIAEFEKQTGTKVDIQVVAPRAENVRLESMFMSDQNNLALPDLVEIEIFNVARFFRPPLNEIGFLPLNDDLKKDDWDQRILPSRLATWTKGGTVFGVPHDVHPVTISYRQDLFRQAGIELQNAKTWPQFQRMCLQFQNYWRAKGETTRHAIELSQSASDDLTILLLQRGVNIVDQNNNIHINDPVVAQTVAFYAELIAGPDQIASESTSGSGVWTNDVIAGNLCAFITPDWRVSDLRAYAPELAGKLRMMPLPKFESTDAPTSTWGGTMIGITRASHHHEAAWKLIEFLYLSRTGLEAGSRQTNIIPPVLAQWDLPEFHREDPFFGGQKIGELYVQLARELPPRYVTPATPIAESELSVVIDRAAKYVQNYGTDGLEPECQKWLDYAAADLRARIQHDRFDE